MCWSGSLENRGVTTLQVRNSALTICSLWKSHMCNIIVQCIGKYTLCGQTYVDSMREHFYVTSCSGILEYSVQSNDI